MFVHPMRRWAQGAVFSTVGALALIACDDPEASTDLRPEGAPLVLSVLVSDDPGGFNETATFCRPNDLKRPGFVAVLAGEVCPDDLTVGVEPYTDANPTNPYIRIQFDELLNPDVEDLEERIDADGNATGIFDGSIAATQPVVLECDGVAVPYDGYYQPSGNSQTWPVGPSLVVSPVDPSVIAAGATCTVALRADVIVDKQGEAVTDTTPFTFGIAALEFQGSDPEPAAMPGEEAAIAAGSPVTLFFNGFVDDTSLTATDIRIEEVTDCTAAAGSGTAQPLVTQAGGDGEILVGTALAGDPGEEVPGFEAGSYIITFLPGAEVTDAAGATAALPGADDFTLCFDVE
jgi:hypothetical protein